MERNAKAGDAVTKFRELRPESDPQSCLIFHGLGDDLFELARRRKGLRKFIAGKVPKAGPAFSGSTSPKEVF